MKTENYFSKHSAVVQLIGEAELHHQNSLLFWQKILELEKTIASDFEYFPEGIVNGLIESVACSAFYYDMVIDHLIQIRHKYQRSKKRTSSNDDPECTCDRDCDYTDNDLIDEVKLDDQPLKESSTEDRKICHIDVGNDTPFSEIVAALSDVMKEISKAKKIKHD